MSQYLFSNTEFIIYVGATIILYKGAIYVSFSNVNIHEEIMNIKILLFPYQWDGKKVVAVQSLNPAWLLTPCTVAIQAPLSRGFPRQEYWNSRNPLNNNLIMPQICFCVKKVIFEGASLTNKMRGYFQRD